ncbi:MAG: arginine--tRNA ligase, partial [Thermoprotei archaeon]
EIVNVPGAKMSSRRGRYITLDELMEEAKRRVLEELKKRGLYNPDSAEKIGIAAIKFTLLQVTPSRPVTFKWENVLNFERNSAPYLLYTYARCMGILRKARELGVNTAIDVEKAVKAASTLREKPSRRRLFKLIAKFPQVFVETSQSLDPSALASYLLAVADIFNSWYDEDPVLREPDEYKQALKMVIVNGVKIVISNGLRLLGIEPLERM